MNLEAINKVGTRFANYFGLSESLGQDSSRIKVDGLASGIDSLEEYLSYRYYDPEEQLFYNDDQVIGFMVEISPIVGINGELIQNLERFFNEELPKDSYIQFLLIASHEIEELLQLWRRDRSNSHQIITKLFNKRAEFMLAQAVNFEANDGRIARDFRIYISYSRFASKNEIPAIITFKQNLLDKLSSLKLNQRMCDVQDLIQVARSIMQMNIEGKNSQAYDANNLIAKQILLPGYFQEIKDKEIRHASTSLVSRCYHRSKLPSEFWLAQVNNFLGSSSGGRSIPARFIISYSLASNISKASRSQITNKGKKVIDSAGKYYSRGRRDLEREAREWQEVNDQVGSGINILSEHWQIMITTRAEEIDRAEQELLSLYNSNYCQLSSTNQLQLPAMLSMLPMQQVLMWPIISRFKLTRLILAPEALAMLPIYAEWKGVNKSGVLLQGRRGQLFNFNPFVKVDNGSFNVVVIAPSGSGKSVFLQEMAVSLVAQNTRIFVLDIGQSFANICRLLGGEIIQFGSNNPFHLNPFASFRVDMSLDDRNNLIRCAKALLELMCGVGGDYHGSSELEKAIVGALEATNCQLDISKFASFLEESGSLLLKKYGQTLYSYTKSGIYGKYFTGKMSASFKQMMTVFEFEEIKNDHKLLGIVLQVLLLEVQSQFVLGDRKVPFMIIVDEAWMLLDYAAGFFSAFARTVRKYGGSLVICVQNFSDMQKSMEHKSILQNSAWTLLLKQDEKGLESFKESEAFKDLVPLIKSISFVPGKYAEVLLHSSSVAVVGRLILDEYSSCIYSTDASDFAYLRSCEAQGIGLEESIERLVEDKNKRKYA